MAPNSNGRIPLDRDSILQVFAAAIKAGAAAI